MFVRQLITILEDFRITDKARIYLVHPGHIVYSTGTHWYTVSVSGLRRQHRALSGEPIYWWADSLRKWTQELMDAGVGNYDRIYYQHRSLNVESDGRLYTCKWGRSGSSSKIKKGFKTLGELLDYLKKDKPVPKITATEQKTEHQYRLEYFHQDQPNELFAVHFTNFQALLSFKHQFLDDNWFTRTVDLKKKG